MKKRRFSFKNLKKILIGLIGIEVISFTVISTASYGLYTDIVRNVTLMTDAVEEKLSYNLRWINESLLQTAVNNTMWRTLDRLDTIEAVGALGNIKANYYTIKEQYGAEFNFFIMNANEEQYLELTRVAVPFSRYRKVRSFLMEQVLLESTLNGKWRVTNLEDERYVYTFYRNGKQVVGAWIEESAFLEKMADGAYGERGEACLIPKDEYDADKWKNGVLTRRILYDLKPNWTDFYILVTINGNDKLVAAVLLQYFILFVGICVLMVSVHLYLYFRRNLLKPMQRLSQQIEIGELKDISKITEAVQLEDAYATITNLIVQMKKMRIELYEQELEKKQIELNFRKIQIKPHFFINCLSSIYYMAQEKDIEGVKTLSLLVSDYFREVLTDGFEQVTLEQEIRHIRNYADVQAHCNAFAISLDIQATETSRSAKLPAMVIGTYVENCVWHGRGGGARLAIKVCACLRQEDERKYLYVSVCDDAGGFETRLLEKLNSSQAPVTETGGRHLGINNALTRLYLLYDGKARTVFSNTGSGAKVEMWIPQGIEEEVK